MNPTYDTRRYDAVDRPAHYVGAGGLEVITIVEGYGLGAHLSQALQYVLRSGRKTADPREDLRKAAWWLRRASLYPGELKAEPSDRVSIREVTRAFALAGRRADVVQAILACHGDRRIDGGVLQRCAELMEAEAAEAVPGMVPRAPAARLPYAHRESA